MFDLALASGAEIDHFVDANKMVASRVPRDLAGSSCLENGGVVEVAPLTIAQQMLKIAGKPKLDAPFSLLGVTFESIRQAFYSS